MSKPTLKLVLTTLAAYFAFYLLTIAAWFVVWGGEKPLTGIGSLSNIDEAIHCIIAWHIIAIGAGIFGAVIYKGAIPTWLWAVGIVFYFLLTCIYNPWYVDFIELLEGVAWIALLMQLVPYVIARAICRWAHSEK